VVANPGVTQPGYSFYAEPTGSTVYTVQFHTNNTAVCFAFNQRAYQLKFNLEHTANTYGVSKGKIFVEGSSDLNLWQGIDTLACYNDGSRMDYTITVPDLSYRYLRLRIDSLENSRNIRRINVRSAQVTPYPTEGNPYTFETMPAEWTSYQGGTTELSTAHFKHLNQSLKWTWTAGSALRVTNPVGINKAPGMAWWIYNETPSNTPITFNLYKAGKLISTFSYKINFKGWRSFWCNFSGIGITLANNPDMIEVKSSSTTSSGTLYIDCVSFSSVVSNNGYNDFHISNRYQSCLEDVLGIYNTARPAATVQPTAAEQAAIDLIAQRWETFLLGSGRYAQNAQMIQKISAVENYIKSCKNNINAYNITRQPNGTVNGTGLFTDMGGYTPLFTDINQNAVMGLALDYRIHADTTSKRKAMEVFDYYNDQGWALGSSMGNLQLQNLRFEGYCHSLFLMRKELASTGSANYKEKFDALYWMSMAGKLFQTGQRLGENTDDIRSSSVGILAYALMESDAAKRLQAVKAFQKYMNNALAITEDDDDMIKPDGSGYHHSSPYNCQYATEGMFQGALYYYLFRDTPFALSTQSYNNMKMVLKNWILHSSNLSYPVSTGGRFPNSDPGSIAFMVGTYAYLAMANPADTEMVAMAKRMCQLNSNYVINSLITSFSTRITHMTSIGMLETMIDVNALPTPASVEPQASSFLPFSGMLLSRYNGWLVAIKGYSKYIWDYEFLVPDNYYGRYLSNDHIQIWNEQRNLNSCTLGQSWDWSRFPGTTAKNLPLDVLCFNAARGDKINNYSDDYFLGGTVLNDSVSMFSNRLHDITFDTSFKAYKSNFLFANTMVSLGTNITDTDAAYNVETNLFQDLQNGTTPQLNGTNWTSSATVALTGTANTVLKNCWGNSYIVYPYGGGTLELRRQTQTTKGAQNQTVPSRDYDVAYINHGKAPANKGYRYITVLGGDDTKTALLAGANTPITVVQQDNNAHIVKHNQLKTTAYAVFATNASFSTGIIASSVRPFVGMVKDNGDGTIDLALSDPDLNRPTGGYTANVTMSITLRGNYQLITGNPTLTFTKQTGTATISQVCKNGATYTMKLKNLDYTALNQSYKNQVLIYPNPARNQLKVIAADNSESLVIELLDINGRQLMNVVMTSTNQDINIGNLSNGVYFLKIKSKDGSEIHKIIKN
jgi:hypothetical protein